HRFFLTPPLSSSIYTLSLHDALPIFLSGRAPTYFWNTSVEDNAFFLLETKCREVAFLHASWTEWKNLFSFEICGRLGKLEITGLDRKSTRLNSSHVAISYAVFCLKKK